MVGTTQDITETKRLEVELLHVKDKTENEERRRLARNIHDGIIQRLQALLLGLNTRIAAAHNGDIFTPEILEETCQDLAGVIQQLRDLSTDLHPEFLDRMTLHDAIFFMCDKLERQSGIEIFVRIGLKLEDLGMVVKRNCYFIFQEAVTNAIKHSRCTLIKVSLEKCCSQTMLIIISDNGQGFDMEEVKSKKDGIGLSIIRERVTRMQGKVDYCSTPGDGTTLTLRIPYNDPNLAC
ncbi:MAG: sensor histidine kinase [Magnetococcales bacterium]|nr:sensor histidine kinase [Magnetococcales bacterium]